MYSIRIYQTATDDLQQAYDWYEGQVSGLGSRFVSEIDEYFTIIQKNPFQFAGQFSGKFRFALLHHFPYRIVYWVNESQKTVHVSAIFHTSRNPQKF